MAVEDLLEDAEVFEEAVEGRSFAGSSKRDVQKWLFRLRTDLKGSYSLEVTGTEMDFEAKLVHDGGDDPYAELYVDTGDGVEVGAFVLGDGEEEVHRFVETRR